jgi:mono/diheme cytochrome c family protein
MSKMIRFQFAMAAVFLLASAMCFAVSDGEATYKAKCQICHGTTGIPNSGMVKGMGVKPVSDPAIKKLTAEQMFVAVKNGKGKMKPAAGLTDAQIKAVVAFYKGLEK